MFAISASLKTNILSKIDKTLSFASLDKVYSSGDCPCQGGCGTYVPPCSCCGYNS